MITSDLFIVNVSSSNSKVTSIIYFFTILTVYVLIGQVLPFSRGNCVCSFKIEATVNWCLENVEYGDSEILRDIVLCTFFSPNFLYCNEHFHNYK